MKRINELQRLLKKKIAEYIPGGCYEEFGNISCDGKQLSGPGVHVYTTLCKVDEHSKFGIENLLNKYL